MIARNEKKKKIKGRGKAKQSKGTDVEKTKRQITTQFFNKMLYAILSNAPQPAVITNDELAKIPKDWQERLMCEFVASEKQWVVAVNKPPESEIALPDHRIVDQHNRIIGGL